MLKWDVSAAKMSKLSLFLQKALKDIYSQHLAAKMNECVACLCYGCVHAKDSKVMHNLCSMHALDWVCFCIYFALDFVDEAAIMEQYGNEVGLAAFEWCDVFDPDYRRSSWIADEEWFSDVCTLVLEKWGSQGSSSCGDGKSSVLPLSWLCGVAGHELDWDDDDDDEGKPSVLSLSSLHGMAGHEFGCGERSSVLPLS